MDTLIVFGFLAAIILVPTILRFRERERLHETLRIALEKGQPIPPDLVSALSSPARVPSAASPAPSAERDLRVGLTLLFVGIGIAAAGYALYLGIGVFSEAGAWITGECVAAAGAIPGFIGIAHLILWRMRRSNDRAAS